MASDIIIVPDEGGTQGWNYKCKGTESVLQLCPLLPLMWSREMAQVTLHYNRSKLTSTPGTPTMHWDVAGIYTEPNFAYPS